MGSEGTAPDLAILFTDVEGSTELSARRGDGVAQAILRAHEEVVRDGIRAHAGREVKTMGDGFMVVFPQAADALDAAVDIERDLERRRRDDPEGSVRVRIGIHAGPVTERGGDVFGQAVNAAARILGKAHGGQILVSEHVREAAGAGAGPFIDRGSYWLKGFPERWRLFEVTYGDGTARATVGLPAGARAALVGRDGERADLRRALEAALAGHGSVLCLGGEPGIGKTRLAQELAAEAEALGALALTGRAFQNEEPPAFGPFVEILEALARAFEPEQLRAALGELGGEVARLLPSLRARFPDLPSPAELPAEQERRYLLASLVEVLERLSAVRPLSLLLDDLQWADASSLALLEALAPRLAGARILVLGTYRDGEAVPGAPLTVTLERLHRQHLVTTVHLGRLTRDEVVALMTELGDGDPPPEPVVATLYFETEGNPFFLEEAVAHFGEEGRLFDATGAWRPTLEVAEDEVPRSVWLLLGERIGRLGEDARRVLQAAAVIGRVFAFDLLDDVVDLDEDTIMDALDEAERAGLLGADDAAQSLAFSHEMIRQTLIRELALPRRQRLHAKVADAIERRAGERAPEQANEIANHLLLAGPGVDPARKVRYLCLAATRALEAAAFEEARRFAEAALAVEGEVAERVRADLHAELGQARIGLGDWDPGFAEWELALDGYERAGEGVAAARLAWKMAQQAGWSGRWEQAVGVAARGLQAVGERHGPEEARLLAMVGVVFSLAGNYQAGEDLMQRAEEVAAGFDDDEMHGDVLALVAIHSMTNGLMDAVVEAGERAVELLRPVGAEWDRLVVVGTLANARLVRGEPERARALADELETGARRIGNLGAEFLSMLNHAGALLMLEPDEERFGAIARRGLEACERGGLVWLAYGHGMIGIHRFLWGSWDEALESFHAGHTAEAELGAYEGYLHGQLVRHLAYMGARDEALAEIDAAADDLPAGGEPGPIGRWGRLFGFAEALAVLGERDRLAALYPLLMAPTDPAVVDLSMDARTLPLLRIPAAAAAGRWDEAEAHFDQARRNCDELPHRLEWPEVRRAWGHALLRWGERDRAAEATSLLGEAIQGYQALRMRSHVGFTRSILDGSVSPARQR